MVIAGVRRCDDPFWSRRSWSVWANIATQHPIWKELSRDIARGIGDRRGDSNFNSNSFLEMQLDAVSVESRVGCWVLLEESGEEGSGATPHARLPETRTETHSDDATASSKNPSISCARCEKPLLSLKKDCSTTYRSSPVYVGSGLVFVGGGLPRDVEDYSGGDERAAWYADDTICLYV